MSELLNIPIPEEKDKVTPVDLQEETEIKPEPVVSMRDFIPPIARGETAEADNDLDDDESNGVEPEDDEDEYADGFEENEDSEADGELPGETEDEKSEETESAPETAEEKLARWAEKNETDKKDMIDLPYIELIQRKTELSKQIDDLKSMKDWLGEMEKSLNGMSKEIAGTNMLDDKNFAEDYKDFLSKYPELLDEAERLVYLTDEVIKEQYGNVKTESTEFLANSLCDSIDRKVATMADSDVTNRQFVIDRMLRIKKHYSDRTNFDIVFRKLQYPQNVRKIYKDFDKLRPEQVFRYINKAFTNVFNDPNMKTFITAATKLIRDYPMSETMANASEYDLVFMVYWLTRMYDREYECGDFAQFKILVMNTYDCLTGVYDLKGGQEYMAYTLQTILAIFRIYLPMLSGQVSRKASPKDMVRDCEDMYKIVMDNYHDRIAELMNSTEADEADENSTPEEKDLKTDESVEIPAT